jgi:hypothetical protein
MHRANLRSTAVRLGMVVSVVCIALTIRAGADVNVHFVDEEFYSFDITHVPDLDQKRSTLPGGGVDYCAPTSSVNWAAYMANHGLPALPPGPGYWGYPEMYDPATNAIYAMGQAMGTEANGTTYVDQMHFGLELWFGFAGDYFTIVSFNRDEDWSPTIGLLNAAAMTGMYVIPSIGWYFELPESYILRDGGHAVSVSYGVRYHDYFRMGIRDPGSDEQDNTVQSPFTTELYDVQHTFRRPVGFGEMRLVSRFPDYTGGGKVGYLDGFTGICPLFVLTTHPTEPGLLIRRWAIDLYGAPVPPIQQWATAEFTSVRSMVLHPDLMSCVYVSESDPAHVYRLDPLTGESEIIPFPLNDPRDVFVNRLRDMYVLDGGDLVRVDIDGWPQDRGHVTLPDAACAMTYEDATDEVVLLAADGQSIIRCAYHLDEYPQEKQIAPPIPLSGRVSMCWDATRDAAWVISEASNALIMLTDSGGDSVLPQAFTHPQLTEPLDMDVNDAGRIFVSNEGMLLEFELTRRGLEPAADPLFPGAEAGAHLCIAKSSSNYVEFFHSGEEWREVLPDGHAEPEADCDADVNDDGAVNVADFLAVLAGWGPCPGGAFCSEDVNHSGNVDVLDVLLLLAAWGPCRPLGACCLDDGSCLDLTQQDCLLQGNGAWFEGEQCATFSCPEPPTGACCVDGECVATNTAYACAQLGGTWFEGQDCPGYECPTAYCDAWGDCGQHISSVRIGEIDNTSGCPSGYSDYTNLSAEIAIGQTRQLILTTGNPQTYDYCGVWVDWDQDLVFDYPRDLVDGHNLAGGIWLTQVGAPLDAKPGPTRMRLCLVSDDFPFPCDHLGPGEVEDYTIVVVE